MAQRFKPAQGFPVLQECFGCGELFSVNHRCKAVNERCTECKLYGHYTEFCQTPHRAQYSQCSDGTQESGYQEGLDPRVAFAGNRRDSVQCMHARVPLASNEETGLGKNYRNHGYLNTSPFSLGLSHAQDCANRPRIETENQHVCNKTVQTDPIQEKSKMTEIQTKQTIENLTRERTLLYNYAKRLESHAEAARKKVSHLGKEHDTVIDKLYEKYSPDKVPPWYARGCKNCGSSIKHLHEDCVARGNTCWNCGLKNHFTAVCNGRDKLTLDVATEERDVLRKLELDMI